MKAIAYTAVLLGLVSTVLGQSETLAPSPTESYGCEPHGDHWHCEGPRTAQTGAVTTTGAPVTTSSAAHNHDDGDEDHDEHTDAAGSGSLKPSPTESYGCEPHGDHWHCAGPVTALNSASGSTLATTTTPPASTGTENVAATSTISTAAAPRFEVAGLGFAGIAAVAAMAL